MRKRSAGLLALLPLLAACQLTPTPWSVGTGPHVGVIGDSLVYLADQSAPAEHLLVDAFTTTGDVSSIAAIPGAPTGALATTVPFPVPGPDVLVVALGTNDMHDGRVPVATAVANIAAYVAESTARCVVLVNVDTTTIAWGLDVYGPPYNAALVAYAASRSNVSVADWASITAAHPEYMKDGGPHHTTPGQAAYRQLIVDAANTCAVTS